MAAVPAFLNEEDSFAAFSSPSVMFFQEMPLEVALQGLDVLGYVYGVEHRFDDDAAVHAHLVALLSAAKTSRIAASLPSSEPCELRPLPSSNALWAAFQASTSCLLYLVGFGFVAGLR